jgi:putative Mg2+ transporter-C (MgtC) family protein
MGPARPARRSVTISTLAGWFCGDRLVAAILVIGANTALRPVVGVINRQPVDSTEEEQHYLITIECRAAHPPDVRAKLVQEVAGAPDLQFSELDSAFIEDTGRVEVTATVTSHNAASSRSRRPS